MIENILENIHYSQAEGKISVNEFRNIVSNKWIKVQNEAKNIKRFTENTTLKLIEIFEEDLFVSFSPVWGGHQPVYLSTYIKSNQNNLISSIVENHTKWQCNQLQRWHNDLKLTDIYNTIDKLWSKKDTEYLQYICQNYSDYINAAAYLFMHIFKNDERYYILYNHFRKDSEIRNENLKTNEIVKERIIEAQTNSDIKLKFIHHYLEIKIFLNNIERGLAIKICKYSGLRYIEYFHISKYSFNHLYLPYCETISGWTTITSNNKNVITYSINEDESLSYLKYFCNIIEGIPSVDDWNNPIYTVDNVKKLHDIWIKSPYTEYYKNIYGDFRCALIKANLIPESAIKSKYGIMCVSKDGHFCRSLAEQKIDNWFYKNNIDHEVEPVYPKHEEFNKSGRLRADWKIKNRFVEYFGLPEDKKYSEKMEKKRNLAKALNLNIIELFYEDLFDLDKSLNIKINSIK